MPGFSTYQCSEYLRVVNILSFQICEGSHYTGFTLASVCTWISLDSSWICLIMCDYPRMLNTSLILSRMVSLRSQFVIFENSAKMNLHLFYETHYHRFLTYSKYAWDPEDASVLDLALFLNKPAVFICTAGIMIFWMTSFNMLWSKVLIRAQNCCLE